MSTTILMTGGNQGLGLAAITKLATKPNLHIFLGTRTLENGTNAIKDLKIDASSKAVQLDVTKADSIAQCKQAVEKSLAGKPLDVLVNNAATAYVKSQEVFARYDEYFRLNVSGPVAMFEAFLPLLEKAEHPRLINVTSDLASFTRQRNGFMPGLFEEYRATKAAINSLSITWSEKHKNIRVVAVNPGYTATAFNNYTGPADPAESCQIYVKTIMEETGESGIIVENEGVLEY